jgi:hypothetical protein
MMKNYSTNLTKRGNNMTINPTKELTITIPYKSYINIVTMFDLDNKDELDQCITHMIDDQLIKQAELVAMDEYYEEFKNG